MSTSASATITNDISYVLTKTGTNQQSEASALGYSQSLSNGTGSLEIDYGVVQSGTVGSGETIYFDLDSLEKTVFGASSNISFSKIKGIMVENRSTSYGYDLNIHATGSAAFTEMFNGGSGGLLIKPYGVHSYLDLISGATVDGSNKEFALEDTGSGADWTLVVVGVTGT
jgi:hypothetical protein